VTFDPAKMAARRRPREDSVLDFARTGYGRSLFENHIPRMVEALERIATQLERLNTPPTPAPTQPSPERRDPDGERSLAVKPCPECGSLFFHEAVCSQGRD
jgi:hypothetical protein